MAGYVDIFIQQDGKFSVSLWRGNIQDVESVIEMLVAALLSGVQWRLIMSSDIFAPWRPATATVYNAHMDVCVGGGGVDGGLGGSGVCVCVLGLKHTEKKRQRQ